MLYKPERGGKGRARQKSHSVIIVVQYLLEKLVTALAVMAKEVEIMSQNLRYSGKNYALTKVWTQFLCQIMFFFWELLMWSFFLQVQSVILIPIQHQSSVLCVKAKVWCSCTALVLLVGSVSSSGGWATENSPSQSESSSFSLSYPAKTAISISLDSAVILQLSQLFVLLL